MKKILAFLLCSLMTVSLFSCNYKNGNTTDPSTDGPTDTTCESPDEHTTEPAEENTVEQPPKIESPENQSAMQAYQAAINGDICVIDAQLGEIELKDCRFPSDNLRLDECKILYKAIVDMDGDGINEFVIQSENKDHIVLRHYDGKVYSYCFDRMSFFNLNNDGSFYWVDSYDLANCTRGYNRIAFDGASCRVKEIYRIKQTSPYDYGDGDHEYFVDGKQITREEFRDYYYSNFISKDLISFTPLDISCEYPISSEKACELAADYWGIFNGMHDGAAGTHFLHTIVILEKPNNDMPIYRIGWYLEGYTNHVLTGPCSQPPQSNRIRVEVIVDAITGECKEYTDTNTKNG